MKQLLGSLTAFLLWGPALPAAAQPHSELAAARDVVINEIHYAPQDNRLEFIELYNRSEKTFDLSRFTFSDSRQELAPITALDRSLRPGNYAVLVRDKSAFKQHFPEASPVEPPAWPVLNNGSDAVVLHAGGIIIDSVSYQPDWGGDGVSLERVDPAGSSLHTNNFGPSLHAAGATPGAQNSIYRPDKKPPRLTFVEEVSARVLLATFSEALDPEAISRSSFRLNGTAPASAALTTSFQVQLLFSQPIAGRTLEASGLSDLAGNIVDNASRPVARQAALSDVIVNEILYAPLANDYDDLPNQSEYIELYNRTNHLISLRGAFVTDRPSEHRQADTLRFAPQPVGLPPGGYGVVFPQSQNVDDPSRKSLLARAFPNIDFTQSSIRLFPASTLGLSNNGDTIVLRRSDGTVLDAVSYSPAWHHPAVEDGRGIALERIAPEGPSDQSANWSSSPAPRGGTPGQPNTLHSPPPPGTSAPRLQITPSPFSPDGDGHADQAIIRYALDAPSALIRVRIYDQRGRLVRTLEEPPFGGSQGTLVWDGFDDSKRPLRLGIYIVLLEAVDTAQGRTERYKAPVVLARPLN